MLKIASLASATLVAAVSFGKTTFWYGAPGIWSDPTVWSNGAPESDGDNVYLYPKAENFEPGATNVLKLTADVALALPQFLIVPYYGVVDGTVVLDGDGHTFSTPGFGTDGPYTLAGRAYFKGYGRGAFFKIENNGGTKENQAWIRAVDPYISFWDDGYRSTLVFGRGDYDTVQPNGEETMIANAIMVNSDSMSGDICTTFTGPDTIFRAYEFCFRGNADTNGLVIADEAKLTVDWRFSGFGGNVRDWTFVTIDHATLENTGKASGGWVYFNYGAGNATWKPKPMKVDVVNGGLIKVAGNGIVVNGLTDFNLLDSTLEYDLAKGSQFCGNGGDTQTVHIARSTIKGGSIVFGYMGYPSTSLIDLLLEDSTLTLTQGGSSVGRGTHVFRNVDFTGPGSTYLFSVGPETKLALRGTNTIGKIRLCVGDYSQNKSGDGRSEVVLADGQTKVTGIRLGHCYPAFLTVTNGLLSTISSDGDTFTELCWQDTYKTEHDSTVELRTGGVLQTVRIFGGAGSLNQGGKAMATLIGNGGTLRGRGSNLASGTYFISKLDSAVATAKGLVIDSNGGNFEIAQDIANAAGEDGLLVKAGAGTMTLVNSKIGVSAFRVDEGAVVVGSGSDVSSAVTVGPGATFNCAGQDLTLGGLAVTNGTIVLDPGDKLTVNGPVSFKDIHVQFTSAPTVDEACEVLEVAGDRNPEAESEWTIAFDGLKLKDGTYLQFSAEYEDGTTVYRATRKTESAPFGDSANAGWTGSGAWATDGNWSTGAKPTAANRAVFADEAAGSPVAISSGDTAGAIRFAAEKGYELSGADPLLLTGPQGANAIESLLGANKIAAPLMLGSRLDVLVDAGSSLTFEKAMSGGSLNKSGGGRLTIAGANGFRSEVSIRGGWNRIEGEGSLANGDNSLAVGAGTLELDETAGANLAGELRLDEKTDASLPIIVKNEGDVEMTLADTTPGGALIKRGAGKLTLDVQAGKTTVFPASAGNAYYGKTSGNAAPSFDEMVFPEDGSKPVKASNGTEDNNFWGVTVAEGELVLKGGSTSKITLPKTIVGSPLVNPVARPVLTVDGAYATVASFKDAQGRSNDGHVYLGQDAGRQVRTGEKYAVDPMIRAINGAYLEIQTLYVGNDCWNYCDHPWPEVRVENSKFVITSGITLAMPRLPTEGGAVYRTTNSTFITRGPAINGGIDAVFDSTQMPWRYEPDACWSASEFAYGMVEFRNGTRFCTRRWSMKSPKQDLAFVWDDAEYSLYNWTTYPSGGGDPKSVGLTSTNMSLDHVSFVMKNAGMRLIVPEGLFFESAVRFTGDGGMVKTGPGLLKFTGNAYQFTGCLNLEGPMDLTEMTEPIANAKIAGSGTVTGGTFFNLTVDRKEGDDIVTLENAVLTGKVRVDLGASELAAPRTLFRIAGTTKPVTGTVKVIGLGGERLAGTVSTVNGVATLTSVYKPGVLILVR